MESDGKTAPVINNAVNANENASLTREGKHTSSNSSSQSKYLKRIDVVIVSDGKYGHKILKTNNEYLQMMETLLEALRNGDKIDSYIVLQKNEINVGFPNSQNE